MSPQKHSGKSNSSGKQDRKQKMRLQKALALGGWGSRRECENLIEEGRVDVDGEIVLKLGSVVDPYEQNIRIDGQRLKLPRFKYFMLNKPTGVVSTARDPAGRTRVIDLIPSDQRVFNVGRLDKSSEGLILVTNDGELANRLTHPKYGVYKTYQVQVAGTPHINELKQLKKGIRLADGFAKVADISIKRRQKNTTDLVIVLDEGRNREIRRLLAAIDHKVLRLKRIAIGTLRLGDLPTGAHRELTAKEINGLWKIADNSAGHSRQPARKSVRRKPSTSPRQGNRSTRTSSKKAGPKKPGSRTHAKKITRSAKSGSPTKTKRPGQKSKLPKSKRAVNKSVQKKSKRQ